MRMVATEPDEALDHTSPGGTGEALLRLRPSILALARARLANFHDAQDAVQETCLRVLRGLGSWRPEAPFEHWVFTVAANVLCDMARRRQVRREAPRFAPEETALPPDQALEAADDLERVRRAIERLGPAESAPLLLFLVHGVPQREVAAHLDIPVEHLRVRLYRAIRKIRRALKE
jgi:RNA polymerase sigma-70 factor (ECF subfamily)